MQINLPTPTEEEVKEYMELHNADEVGENDQWDMETAKYFLELGDEWHYKRKEALDLWNKANGKN